MNCRPVFPWQKTASIWTIFYRRAALLTPLSEVLPLVSPTIVGAPRSTVRLRFHTSAPHLARLELLDRGDDLQQNTGVLLKPKTVMIGADLDLLA
jgi:hypothetical protein